MLRSFQNIVLPTDFSDASTTAFGHALRIVLATKGKLNLIHVADTAFDVADDAASFDDADIASFDDRFPHIRYALALWKLMDENDSPAAVARLGIKVKKTTLAREAVIPGLMRFLEDHPTDLLVLATHGRDGLAHWLQGSIAESISRAARVATLFIPSNARGFVDQRSGQVHLSRILMPIDHSPSPTEAFDAVRAFVGSLNQSSVHFELIHVGGTAPLFGGSEDFPVTLQSGDPVSAILTTAKEKQVDLIAMPTAGHHGFLDALRGSTTERVLRHAACPVLALPANPTS
jgi:nucleotide-binding universal stress UspA family protein